MSFMVSPEVLRIAEDIRNMKIRGASYIARSAAQALMKEASQSKAKNSDELIMDLTQAARILLHTRPTAVSLPNAIRYVMVRAYQLYEKGLLLEDLRSEVIKVAEKFIETSKMAVKKIAEYGSKRIEDGDLVMTHCHSTAACAILLKAWEEGKRFEVISTETRPRYQGRITASILSRAGIPVTLIVDSAARFFMEKVDKVIVGADAVAANGAVVNKIGTSLIALAAHEARVNFFVAAETYKFSPETMLGSLIKIEERSPLEVVDEKFLTENPNLRVLNPVFDVTPPTYIDIIITEKGVIPPGAAILVLKEEFGWFSAVRLPEFLKF